MEENVEVETNVEEQVETVEEPTNAEETVSPEVNVDESAYDTAFDDIDVDNPDMSLFTEKTTVEEEPANTEESNEIEEDEPVSNDLFAVDEDGYLMKHLVDRGKEIRITPEELFAFGNKGTNYENKNAEIKPFKNQINLMKKHNISMDDLQSLADLSSGKKEALKHLISKYDVDVYDVDTSEEKYTPEVEEYNSDPVADVWSNYQKQNPDSSEKVSEAFNSISEDFRQEVYNEKTLPLFADDVARGVFDKLYPEAQKIKALYPDASWLQAYSEANNRLGKESKKTEPKNVGIPRDNRADLKIDHKAKADDIWDSPEAFADFEKQLTY